MNCPYRFYFTRCFTMDTNPFLKTIRHNKEELLVAFCLRLAEQEEQNTFA